MEDISQRQGRGSTKILNEGVFKKNNLVIYIYQTIQMWV